MAAEVKRGGVGEEVGRPTKKATEMSSGGVAGLTGGVAGPAGGVAGRTCDVADPTGRVECLTGDVAGPTGGVEGLTGGDAERPQIKHH